MATTVRESRPKPASVPAAPSPLPVKRFSLDEYHRLIEIGMLTEDDPYELLHGWIVEKMPNRPPHASAAHRLARRLDRLLGDAVVVRTQMPITLPGSGSEPEPDVVVASGTESDYDDVHPHPKDVLLVAEVAHTSVARDTGLKLTMYADARLPEYWIVNLPESRVEVHTGPRRGKNPMYRQRRDYGIEDAVPVSFGGKVAGSIPVGDILPK